MYKKVIGFLIFSLYSLVLFVAIDQGPLVSMQSFILGIAGMVVIILASSSIAIKIRLIDESDSDRKEHDGKIPLVGGIGLFASLFYASYVFGFDQFYLYLVASLVPIMIVGLVDGIRDVRPVYRVIAQIFASWIIILSTDIYVKNLGDLFGLGLINLGQLGIPFTIFGVVGICNAFNMIDGKDGLLGSVTVVIMCSLLLLFFLEGQTFLWGQIVAFSVLIYLAFNLDLFGKRRKIFLGDHGSTGLGHLVAWTLIYLSQSSEIITPVSALWFVSLPLTDALLTCIRRYKSSVSIFNADRLHFHHKLSDIGYTDRSILLIFSIITILSCAIAVITLRLDIQESIVFYGYITLFAVMALLGFIKPESKSDS